jgi:hypothetical protein
MWSARNPHGRPALALALAVTLLLAFAPRLGAADGDTPATPQVQPTESAAVPAPAAPEAKAADAAPATPEAKAPESAPAKPEPQAAKPAPGWHLDDFTQTYAPNQLPSSWISRKFSPLFGNGDQYFFQFVHKGPEHMIVLKSGSDNSFSVGVDKPFRLQDWPVVEWEWYMVKLPVGGDVRVKERDDQAGCVCIVVNPGLVGFKSLCYLFENDGPKDKPIISTRRDNARYLIIRTAKADPIGTWLKERRNALEDYKRVYGAEPDQDAVFGLQIDANDTHTSAEAHYRNIYMRKAAP